MFDARTVLIIPMLINWFFIKHFWNVGPGNHFHCASLKHVYNTADAFTVDECFCIYVSSICNSKCITHIPNHLFQCSCYVIVPCSNVYIPNCYPFKINHIVSHTSIDRLVFSSLIQMQNWKFIILVCLVVIVRSLRIRNMNLNAKPWWCYLRIKSISFNEI